MNHLDHYLLKSFLLLANRKDKEEYYFANAKKIVNYTIKKRFLFFYSKKTKLVLTTFKKYNIILTKDNKYFKCHKDDVNKFKDLL